MALLGLLAIVRDECSSYAEWMAHHRAQGVAHFFLIDHNSRDIHAHSSCQRTLQAPDVTMWRWPHSVTRDSTFQCRSWDEGQLTNCTSQVAAYNEFLPHIKRSKSRPTWLAVWDVDEYAFAVNSTLASYLQALDNRTRQVCMPWLEFGSNGRKKQPTCITRELVHRHRNAAWIGKCMQRTAEITHTHIHRSVLRGETYAERLQGCACPNRKQCSCCGRTFSPSQGCRARITDTPDRSVSPEHRVRLHHYRSQSAEHVQRRRHVGDVNLWQVAAARSTTQYWQRYDSAEYNQIVDTTLSANAIC